MNEERKYLQSLLRVASAEKTMRAYYEMEGALRSMTFNSVQSALASTQVAELISRNLVDCDSVYREAADINKLGKVASR